MTKKIEPKPNRIIRNNSPQREADLAKLREQIEAEKPELLAKGKSMLRAAKAKRAELANVFESLKAEREKLGLSLAEMSERTGMAREVIYRLESGASSNPTLSTIQRYASALGLEISFALKRI